MRAIPMDTMQPKDLVFKLTVELDEALRLLKESDHMVNVKNFPESQSLPTNLLDQCLALCKQHYAAKPEPIRMVHHFACTGGTLISKCIASMPNTQLLSEVDPLSTPVNPSDKSQFSPSDMIALMRQSTRGVSTELIIDLFLNNLGTIYSESLNCGLRLILRDHVHSRYCMGTIIPERPSLLSMIETRFSTKSVVIVRDPIDSYMSLKDTGWVHFSPSTFDEYCARYAAFIHSCKGSSIIRYEDFINDPPKEMKKICKFLDLPFNPDFREIFSVHRTSGNSAYNGDIIKQRPLRSIDAELLHEMETSVKYQSVQSMLGYRSEKQGIGQIRLSKLSRHCSETRDNLRGMQDSYIGSNVNTPSEDVEGMISKAKKDIVEALQGNNANLYVHNRTITPALNKDLREFLCSAFGIENMKATYIDYMAAKAIEIEKNCVGRLATTVQDAVVRQVVAESVTGPTLTVLEIGSLYGVNLAILYNHCSIRFETVKVVGLDPLAGYYGKATDTLLNIPINKQSFLRNMHLGNVLTESFELIQHYSTAPEALEAARQQQINLLIIDGDHSYDGVEFDYNNYFPLLQVGGYVIFDDYDAKEWPAVTAFVDKVVKKDTRLEFIGSFSRTAIGRRKN